MDNKKEITELLIRLKKVHALYQVANEEQRGKLLEACQKTFDKLDVLTGLPRTFFETLTIGGKDFLESLNKDNLNEVADEYDASLIFSN
jgi:hypothetical protein